MILNYYLNLPFKTSLRKNPRLWCVCINSLIQVLSIPNCFKLCSEQSMKGYIRLSSYIFYALTSLDSPSPSFKTVVYVGVSSSSQGSYYGQRKEHSLLSALKLSRVFWDSRVLVGCNRCNLRGYCCKTKI